MTAEHWCATHGEIHWARCSCPSDIACVLARQAAGDKTAGYRPDPERAPLTDVPIREWMAAG